MDIQILGTGNKYSVDLLPHSLVVGSGSVKLLINCGPGVPKLLHQLDLIPTLTHVCVLDGEFSSIGGLELLGLRCKDIYGHKPVLIYPKHLHPYFVGRIQGTYFNPSACFNIHGYVKPVSLNSQIEFKYTEYTSTNSCTLYLKQEETEVLIYPLQPFRSLKPTCKNVIATCCADSELENSTSYKELLDLQKEGTNIYVTGYRDRDQATLPQGLLNVLEQEQTFSL